MQRDIEGILNSSGVAIASHAGSDRLGRTKERQGLIYKMGPKIEEHPVGVVPRLFPGSLARQRPEAVEMRLEGYQTSQVACVHKLAEGDKVSIPATIVEGSQHQLSLRGNLG